MTLFVTPCVKVPPALKILKKFFSPLIPHTYAQKTRKKQNKCDSEPPENRTNAGRSYILKALIFRKAGTMKSGYCENCRIRANCAKVCRKVEAALRESAGGRRRAKKEAEIVYQHQLHAHVSARLDRATHGDFHVGDW